MDKDSITLAIAITGAVTGILGLVFNFLNTWRAFDRDKVKLKIIPKVYYQIKGGFLTVSSFDEEAYKKDPNWRVLRDNLKHLCIEVVNRGFLPVTISEVGFITDSTRTRIMLIRPLDVEGSKLPHRLEPFAGTTIYGSDPDIISKDIPQITKAYCKTDSGHVFYGKSPALKEFVQKAKNKK